MIRILAEMDDARVSYMAKRILGHGREGAL